MCCWRCCALRLRLGYLGLPSWPACLLQMGRQHARKQMDIRWMLRAMLGRLVAQRLGT